MIEIKINFIIFTFCVVFVNCAEIINHDVLVTLPNGIIRGELRQYFFAFEGIPYAEPPIGVNRFAPPKPILSQWEGIRNTTKPGEACMQWDHFIFHNEDKIRGSEDCLFLNIYTPPNLNPEQKYPVIFYIHGGAFMFGNSDFYGPHFLLQKSMIFVTINYRLGPLGFLSTEDDNIPGNMGLKDQSLALKWINQNIERFGGDPNKITISGQSAGGASVHLHYMSPLSNGLFSNGISHSGCALNPWVMTENAGEKAKKLANSLGCPTCCNIQMTECLKTKPAEDIVRAVKLFLPWLYNPFTPFGPTIESPSEHAFITESPQQILEKGNFQSVPWLVSIVESEGLYPAAEFLKDNQKLQELESRWSELVPFILDFNDTVPIAKHQEISNKIKEHYFNERPISEETFPELVKMITDRMFVTGLQRAAKLQAKNSQAPVYVYYYKFSAPIGIAQILSNRFTTQFGPAHNDDIFLILSNIIRGTKYTPDEQIMQNKFINMYFNYANSNKLEFGEQPFECVQSVTNDLNYMEIINPFSYSIKSSSDLAEKEFWKNIPYN